MRIGKTSPLRQQRLRKHAARHDLLIVHPDVEVRADDVDVSGRGPVGAGMGAVGIAEGDVHARELLVLQNEPMTTSGRCSCRSRIRPHGRCSRRCACTSRNRHEGAVRRRRVNEAVLLDGNRQRRAGERSVFSQSQSPTTPSMTNVPLTSPGAVKISPPGRLPHFSVRSSRSS